MEEHNNSQSELDMDDDIKVWDITPPSAKEIVDSVNEEESE